MKPKTGRPRKEREIDKDTVVAYHEFLQGRIQGELNGVTIGPGYTLSRFAFGFFGFGFICMIVGILVITLRHRHVYLVSWDDQFLGPFFIIMFLLSCAVATFLLLIAKRRTNQYRKDLAFRPIGDYGVAVVHKSKLNYDDQKKTELKSGTTPHNVRHPGRPGVNDKGNRGDYSKNRGYDNRGYNDDNGRRTYDDEKRRERDREMSRDQRDGRGPGDRPRGDRQGATGHREGMEIAVHHHQGKENGAEDLLVIQTVLDLLEDLMMIVVGLRQEGGMKKIREEDLKKTEGELSSGNRLKLKAMIVWREHQVRSEV
ncbi:uncharacterized protein LOC132747427 [Ruditapes philippinarum]|uniref:uncharacterized protein LOC132747427 n=1 Tax=Ruditapes philippinarum TaxID=129788 RepID=UPI00295AD9D5|nr:uncharacterized protein LOC132747427 [Ruditapes philippinarum]